jgi:organic radical activating enzyme
MTPWQKFYSSIQDASWPTCEKEQEFFLLPERIQQEIQQVHGYVVGEYNRQPSLVQKVFPIKSETACQLKWNWSSIFLTDETTASCHRTNHHKFDLTEFNFHNTPSKIADRENMLAGKWPAVGCEYCRNIESTGGQSDRITNLNMPGMYSPVELESNPQATYVTPRILEVYFDNTCNLKCVYCGPHFSSLWDAENRRYTPINHNKQILFSPFDKSTNLESNKKKLFEWLKINGHTLTNFNILGGEPLFQKEFDQCLEIFKIHPAPNLDLQIFSNLNVDSKKIAELITKMQAMISQGSIKNFTVTASLDCWGASQEYTRYPLNLAQWERNFLMLLDQPWIKIVIGSTITPLTIGTHDQLLERINIWRQKRPVYHYFNSVNSPSYMYIDIFGDLFVNYFERCLELFDSVDESQLKLYFKGIAEQSYSNGVNIEEVKKLTVVLNELDRRRNTNWRLAFPWLVKPIDNIAGKI